MGNAIQGVAVVDWISIGGHTPTLAGTAINAAIAALPANGGTVYIPAGTWTLDKEVLWTGKNVVIVGDGWGSQIHFDGIAIPTAFAMADTTTRSIIMRDLSIWQDNASNGGTAIDASFCVNSKFQNIRIDAGNGNAFCTIGITLNGAGTFYNLIENCRISTAGVGSTCVAIHSGNNSNIVRNCRVIGDSGGNTTGLYVNGNGVIADRIDMETHGLIGIHVDSAGNNVTLMNPYLENLTTGIQLESASGPVTMISGDLGGCSTPISDLGCRAFSAVNFWNGSFLAANLPLVAATSIAPSGAIAQTILPGQISSSTLAVISGDLYLFAVQLEAGQTVSNITFMTGTTAGVTLTHGWFALLDKNFLQQAHSADQTSGGLTGSLLTTKAMVTSYTATYSGTYWIGLVVVAGTQPTMAGLATNQGSAGFANVPVAGLSTTGLSGPGTDGSTSYAAPTTIEGQVYGYVS